jgi:NAD(P)H-hydrate epimerase
VVVSAALGDNGAGGLALAHLPASALDRLDAVVLGPGLGPPSAEALTRADQDSWQRLQAFPGLLLLDADALNHLAQHDPLGWLRDRAGPTWLTPHPGEFQRLFPQWAERPALEAARRGAEQASGHHPCSLLLKGARSLVAAADGRLWQLRQACEAAARAGLGDVLAGYAGGLGARGLASGQGADAALLALGALSHASAGRAAAQTKGAGGATPMAVAEMLPAITQ